MFLFLYQYGITDYFEMLYQYYSISDPYFKRQNINLIV